MDWLVLGAFGIIWAAFLLPSGRRQTSPRASVKAFGRNMDLLAHTGQSGHGRWIVTPRKGIPIQGEARARARVRERRKKVLLFLLEAIGITALIGMVPPLRIMWGASAVLVVALGGYVYVLLWIKSRERQRLTEPVARTAAGSAPPVAAQAQAVAPRYRADDASARNARPTFNGLGTLGEGDTVHVVVHEALPANA